MILKRHIILRWIKIAIYSTIITTYIASSVNGEQNPAPELEDLLTRLEKQHGDMKTLAARFRQEKHFSFMDKPIISQGFIFFSSPNRIRFDITKPFQTALLSDGKNIERYEFIDGQWRSMQLKGGKNIKLVIDQIGQWMQGKFSKQKRLFALSVSVDDPNDYVSLDLEPRSKQFRQYIEKIRIHIAKPPEYNISRIDIYEPKGDRFALVFVQDILNQELPKNCFSNPQTAIQCKELFLQEQTETLKEETEKKE
jgi:outer membrane lipoprotein-sorting protein